MILGIGTIIYHTRDLARATQWYADVFDTAPYFDEPYYVGFDIGGYELGLSPDLDTARPGVGGAVGYWRVEDINGAVDWFVSHGAMLRAPAQDVGGGIKVATVSDPEGNLIGLLENPDFRARE